MKHRFKKKVRMISNTALGITFTKQEREIYGIQEGDYIDLSDMIIISEKLNELKEENEN